MSDQFVDAFQSVTDMELLWGIVDANLLENTLQLEKALRMAKQRARL